MGLKIDEQEATRFLLLSPETSQEKIREAIPEKIKKETDTNAHQEWLNNDPERKLLKERIRAIKQENIGEIKISSPQEIEERFLGKGKILKPRDPRDIGRVISLVKCFALLNLWFREKEGSAIIASDNDVNEAFRIWDDLPPLIVPLVKLESMESWPQEQVVGSLGHCAALVDCIPCVTPQ